MSDHDGMVLVDCDIKPKFNRHKPRIINVFSKANWTGIAEENEKFNCPELRFYIVKNVISVNHVNPLRKKLGEYRGCMVGGGTSQTNMTHTVIGNWHLKSPRAYIILSANCSMIQNHTLIGWRDQPSNRKLFLLIG